MSKSLEQAALAYAEARKPLARLEQEDAELARQLLQLAGRRTIRVFGAEVVVTEEIEAALWASRKAMRADVEASVEHARRKLEEASRG